MIRDKFIFLIRKLSIWTFLVMFVYMIFSELFLKSYGLLPQYVVVLFFIALLFFGLSFIPAKLSKEYIFAWLMFISFMFIAIGGGIAFTLTFVFKFPTDALVVIIGAMFFMMGIVLMIISVLPSQDYYRNQNEIVEIEKSFKDIAQKYNFQFENKSTSEKFYLEAKGSSDLGFIILSVENEYFKKKGSSFFNKRSISKKLPVNMSKIEIKSNKKIEFFRILTINEAIQIDGLNEPLKSEVINVIKQKQLNYFNFRLYGKKDMIFFDINIAIEELELWQDYLKLIEYILIKN